jgi:putative phosphoribosyl transferase
VQVERVGPQLLRVLDVDPRVTRIVAVTCSAEPLARYVAEALGLQPELLRIARIRLPGDDRPIGALDDEGRVCITSDDCHLVTPLLVARAVENGRAEIANLPRRNEGPSGAWAEQAVVLVDDVCATGSAMVVAARRARAHGAAFVVAAVGLASAAAVERMRAVADEVVVVEVVDRLPTRPVAPTGGPGGPRRGRDPA